MGEHQGPEAVCGRLPRVRCCVCSVRWGGVVARRLTAGGYRYYEWMKKGKERLPHFTKRADGRLMLLAGLWDRVVLEGASRGYALAVERYC